MAETSVHQALNECILERDALAESHAALVEALDFALPYAQTSKISLNQNVRDKHARTLYKAESALAKPRKPQPRYLE